MASQSLVTIGIPVYNEEKYIAETIESAISQSYDNLQIIISDNASTDQTFAIAQKYAEQDDRIVLVRQPQNIGASPNFKYVLQEAKGDYFCWLGGHDTFSRDYIKEAVTVLDNNRNVVMTYPVSRLMDVDSNKLAIDGSDIHTIGMGLEDRLCKVVNNLHSCVAIHGIFRIDVVKSLPFENVIGSDHFMLFVTAFYGDIFELPIEGIFRRMVRVELSLEETIARHTEWGIYENNEKLNLYAFLACCHYVFVLKHLGLVRSFALIKRLQKIFRKRFRVHKKDVVRALAYRLVRSFR